MTESRVEGVDLAKASRVLSVLAERELPYVVVGSLARCLLGAQPPAQPPGDVDLLAPGDLATLNRLVEVLLELGFTVYSWQDPVRPPLEGERLRGRFYLRAVRGSGLVLDVTYESPLLPFSDAWQRRV